MQRTVKKLPMQRQISRTAAEIWWNVIQLGQVRPASSSLPLVHHLAQKRRHCSRPSRYALSHLSPFRTVDVVVSLVEMKEVKSQRVVSNKGCSATSQEVRTHSLQSSMEKILKEACLHRTEGGATTYLPANSEYRKNCAMHPVLAPGKLERNAEASRCSLGKREPCRSHDIDVHNFWTTKRSEPVFRPRECRSLLSGS